VTETMMSGMSKHARLSRARELAAQPRVLLGAVIVAGCLGLTVPAFAVLFLTVTRLLRPWFGHWAWTVPICTETGYVVVYLADLLMEMCERPVRWLRFVPLPFVAASLWLNVYAADGHLAAMVGHAVVTVTFFGTLAVAKMAARRLIRARGDAPKRDAIPLSRWLASRRTIGMWKRMVLQDVMSYPVAVAREEARMLAIDLVRASCGRRWKRKVPALLRHHLVTGTLPSDLAQACEAASYGRAVIDGPAEKWVTDALTAGTRTAAKVKAEKRVIEREAAAADATPKPAAKPRQRTGQRRGTSRGTTQADKRAIVLSALADNPERTDVDIAAAAGVSAKTVSRYRNSPLHSVS
jgi:Protein of unknown function (DUF2637)